ncbi:MAG: hypothetical protein Fur0043_05060 [Anaerolineales bacterium]
MRRDYLFWGSLLILLGGLKFLQAAGISLPGNTQPMQLFWPSVWILLGGWLILNNWGQDETGIDSLVVNLQDAQRASLRLHYGGGRMKLAAGTAEGHLLEGTVAGKRVCQTNLVGDLQGVSLELKPNWLPAFVGKNDATWNLRLNRHVPLSMQIDSGAAQSIKLAALRDTMSL